MENFTKVPCPGNGWDRNGELQGWLSYDDSYMIDSDEYDIRGEVVDIVQEFIEAGMLRMF